MQINALSHRLDINGDGSISRWEVLEALKWVYHLPGNLILEGLSHVPYASGWLGIDATSAGHGSLAGLAAVVLSLLVWLAVIAGLLSLRLPARPARAAPPTEMPLRPEH